MPANVVRGRSDGSRLSRWVIAPVYVNSSVWLALGFHCISHPRPAGLSVLQVRGFRAHVEGTGHQAQVSKTSGTAPRFSALFHVKRNGWGAFCRTEAGTDSDACLTVE